MRVKRMICVGSICVIFTLLGSLLGGGDAWGQAPLTINYSTLSMSCGGSQNLSASGGCSPYTWSLSGGGTLTGGDNTSATYVAPASNPNCGNNAMIVLTDNCKNMVEIQIAVNCYTLPTIAFQKADLIKYCCYKLENGVCGGRTYDGRYGVHIRQWGCDNTVIKDCTWNPVPCPPPPPCVNFCPCYTVDEPGCWNYYDCRVTYGSCNTFSLDPAPCDTLVDKRTTSMKDQGCCPIDPDTGRPYDDGFSDSEDRGKNTGEPPNSCSTGIFQGNPINVATGNKFEKILDLTISTPGIPLEFRRSYNSQITFGSPLGYGWAHTYDMYLGIVQTSPIKRIRIWDADGRALYFSEVQQTSTEILFGGESGVKDRLKQIISTGEYVLRRKEGNLTYKFGSDGKLFQISDPNGNSLTLTYSGGLLTQVSNNFGKTLTIQYNADSRISSIIDPKNQSILYEYLNGDLTKVIYPDQNFIRYTYSNHNLTDKYDTNDNLFGHWEYDNRHRVINYYSHLKDSVPQGEVSLTYQAGATVVTRSTGTTTYTTDKIDEINVVKEVEGCSGCGGQHKRLEYNQGLEVTSITYISETGEIKTQFAYNELGEILQKTEAVGLSEERKTYYTYTHDPNDPLLVTQRVETRKSVVDPNNNRTSTNNYDNHGNLLSQEETGYVLIDGVPTLKTYRSEYQYNSYGQLTQINGPRTDVADVITQEYYNNSPSEGNNRAQLKAIVNALGQRTEFSEYDANGNVGKITDPNGVITLRTYDQRNRIKTTTNQTTGALTQYFYYARGNLITVIMPEGNTINSTYDLANRLIEISDSLGNKIVYGYDVEGNRIREETKDPQGNLKKYLDFTYDANGRLKRVINPDGTYTDYTYDSLGNRITMKDAKNYITNYTFDNLSRLKDMTQPLSVITQYGHDTQDNRISVIDPKGNTTQYQYDDFGRRMKTISPDTGTTTYRYDEAGNLIQKTDAKGTVVNYTYDALNRITVVQFPSDPSQDITYTYDSTSVTNGIGRLTGRADSSGSYIYHYDVNGNQTREEKTISGIPYTTQYTYNNNNILTSITYPSGRTVTFTLDQTGRVTQVSTTLNGNLKVLASNLSYLPYGGITGLTYGNGLSLSHGYDNQYRTSSIAIGSIMSRAYQYDPNGNITSILDAIEPSGNEIYEDAGTYTYQQATNRLTQVTGEINIIYGYDANGNITSANNRSFAYDLSNRLIGVEENGNSLAQYVYNGLNQRVKKILPTETQIFHYDVAGHLIVETNASGATLVEYFYLGDQPLAMIRPGNVLYYYHNDHLGTPQILTDDTGTISWKAFYTPFGDAEISIDTVDNPFRFPGQYFDQETGLHYNWNRYYDPKTGRYLTPDPIGLEGGINLFPYVGSNPINNTDPFGLHRWRDPRTGYWVWHGSCAGNPPHSHPNYDSREKPCYKEQKPMEIPHWVCEIGVEVGCHLLCENAAGWNFWVCIPICMAAADLVCGVEECE